MSILNTNIPETDKQVISHILSVIFSNPKLIPIFTEALQDKLDQYTDEALDKAIETLEYWNSNEDFRSLSKLEIISRYSELP